MSPIAASMFVSILAVLPPVKYLPCTPGLELRYRIEQDGKDTRSRITDRIRGLREVNARARHPGFEQTTGLCIIDRKTEFGDDPPRDDAYALEVLSDRVSSAGWVSQLVALRTPLLKAPLESGARWRFGAVEFRIVANRETMEVPAGRFEQVLIVEERAMDGAPYRARTAYAPGIGMIRREEGGRVRLLISVQRSRKIQPKRGVTGRDGPLPPVVSPSPQP